MGNPGHASYSDVRARVFAEVVDAAELAGRADLGTAFKVSIYIMVFFTAT